MSMRALPLLALAIFAAGCTGGGESAQLNGPSPSVTRNSSPSQGAPATWRVDRTRPPRFQDQSFTALVTRPACSGGITGDVFAPTVREYADRVLVGFQVEALARQPYGCVGNPSVRVTVPLRKPLGDRRLIDAVCLSTPSLARTAFCPGGAIRWPLNPEETP